MPQPTSSIPALMQTALGHYRAGALDEACRLFERVLRIEPKHPDALHLLGLTRCMQGDSRRGIQLIRRAIAYAPGFVDAHSNLGIVLQKLGRDEEALASFEKALAIKPGSIEALNNRSNTLEVLGRFEEALACLDKSVAIKPDHPETLNNRGNVLRSLGRFTESLADFEKVLAIAPSYADAHLNRSLCLISSGDYGRGWAGYEWRWKTRVFAQANRNFPGALWLGQEDVSGKTVLFHAEQGLGDTIQFCRFVPDVTARGAEVVLVVPASLKALLGTLSGRPRVIAEDEAIPRYDFHCPLMSLPLALDTRLETVPARVPYLASDPDRSARWRERLRRLEGPKIGLVWGGQRGMDRLDERRSMPLERMLEIGAGLDTTLVSLQKGTPAAQAQARGASARLIDWTDELVDFADTAALVAALDLVITVDTSVGHLTGSLAKPVWVLNRFDRCWRWLRHRDDSPWYPTMRLFTQPRPGDWASVIAQVSVELARFLAPRRSAGA
jgi:tetratricopeptide (TPR) repeat protein